MARPSRTPGRGTALTVALAHRPVRWLGPRFLDLEISGFDHVPATGGAVLAGNHLSHIDPVVVTVAARRNVRYLAVEELFGEYRFFDWLTLQFGAIPISREKAQPGALRTALSAIEAGDLVGVFPEGRRVLRWRDSSAKQGAAWLAQRSGVPVVPVAIAGSEGMLSPSQRKPRRTPVRVWVLEPIDSAGFPPTREGRAALTEAWVDAVADQLDHWYRD